MSHLLFDAQGLDSRPSGTKTRLLRLVPELVHRGHEVTVLHRPGLDADARLALRSAYLVEWKHAPPRNPVARGLLQRSLYKQVLASVEVDLVTAETWPMPGVDNLVPAVHDLRYLGLRQPVPFIFLRMLNQAAKRALRVHVLSHTMARALVGTGRVDPAKIDVVPLSVESSDLARLAATPSPLDVPYVFVVGHAEPRKDLPLVGALARCLRPRGVEVVRAGRGETEGSSKGYRAGRAPRDFSYNPDDTQALRAVGIVTDSMLERWYHHSVAVIAPSRHEGFGLVPLEALAAGAWVIASSIPAHREVLADAADFFSPGSVAEAMEAVERALEAAREVRQARQNAGRIRAAAFNTSSAADAFESSMTLAGLR